jgi:catechol 2,3-dioxygenase-like lactoylglutathione lyase family enzyme
MGGIDPEFRIKRATFAVAAEHLDAMEAFYGRQLGLPEVRRGRTYLKLTAGPSELRFSVASPPSDPFYHFALLVPGNRFDAAHRWLAETVPLLTLPGSSDTVFHFDFWDARACYANDPASNILELIAHRGVEESPATTRDFSGSELRGLSEVGIVASDLPGTVERLRAATLELWSGQVSDSGTALGFFGRKAHTLILTSPVRPWLPTQRPGEQHPVEVVIGADNTADVVVRLGDTAPLGQGD